MEKSMIIRTIVLAVALLNQFLVMGGLSPLPFESEQIEYGVTAVFTIVATLWAWYKNNSITKEAQEGDRVMKELKEKNKQIN